MPVLMIANRHTIAGSNKRERALSDAQLYSQPGGSRLTSTGYTDVSSSPRSVERAPLQGAHHKPKRRGLGARGIAAASQRYDRAFKQLRHDMTRRRGAARRRLLWRSSCVSGGVDYDSFGFRHLSDNGSRNRLLRSRYAYS